MTTPTLPAPWRIEGRSTPFTPWFVIRGAVHRLDDATKTAATLKAAHRYYAVRIRAN